MLPAYDRRLHNPVQEAVMVDDNVSIVLVEGLFTLLDEHDFHALPYLDMSVFLHVDENVCRQRAVSRKARTNQISESEAMAHYERVDGPNYELITHSGKRADVCFYLSHDFSIQGVTVQNAERFAT